MTNLVIAFHDGTHLETQMDAYDPDLIAAKLNDNTSVVVAIGSVVVNRNVVRAVYEPAAAV